ncbi:MAG: antitoxin VbhA family protein [Oscillospiraceae bacterium]|nr:antitoxin VbhA family protein [Oscillospiraceae bacterium]
MNENRIDYIINNAKRSMEVEGFVIDDELERTVRSILNGELTRTEFIEKLKLKAMRYASGEI